MAINIYVLKVLSLIAFIWPFQFYMKDQRFKIERYQLWAGLVHDGNTEDGWMRVETGLRYNFYHP